MKERKGGRISDIQRIRLLEKHVKRCVKALAFYANPETYFAIGFFPDPPCGEFMTDFYETELLGRKPGKRARKVLEDLLSEEDHAYQNHSYQSRNHGDHQPQFASGVRRLSAGEDGVENGRDAVMGRPAEGYKLDGERVPGCTTIAGLIKPPGPLMHWSWECGTKGLDYRKVRDDAAGSGTCLHDMIEEDWHGRSFDRSKYEDGIIAKADHAFLAYLKWKEQTQLKVVKPELSLISRKHRFGGTMDCLLVGGELAIGDYKSANAIYEDMLIQVAGGYALLYEEHFPEEKLTGMHLLRFSKPKEPDDPISFAAHYWSAEIFPIAKRQFLLLREAYELQKRLKGLL